jgi:hypothetical protein
LHGETEIGDGTVARAIRSLQREFWRPLITPAMRSISSRPR